MGYTDEEVRSVVEKLMLTAPRRGFDTLGVRATGLEGGDYLEIISTSIINSPGAPWHLAKLGAARALEAIGIASAVCARLLAEIREVDRRVDPIRDLSALSTARAALVDLDAATSSRTKATTTSTAPAFSRFARSVDRFLGQYGNAIKRDGDVVMTPSEARANLKSDLEALRSSIEIVDTWAADLAGVEASFAAVGLPARVASGVISRSRQLLDTRLAALEDKTPEARVEDLRSTVLEVVAAKSLIARYGNPRPDISGPRTSGTGIPWSDASHLANPASVTGVGGPYAIVNFRELDLWSAAAPAKSSVGVVITVFSNLGQVQPFRAVMTRAAGSFVTEGVVAGDVVYVSGGTNDQTRWLVQSVTALTLTVVGATLVSPDSGTIEVFRVPEASLSLPESYVAQFLGSAPMPITVPPGGATLDVTALLATETPIPIALSAGILSADGVVAQIQNAIDLAGLNGIVGVSPTALPVAFDGVVDVTVPGDARFTLQAGDLTALDIQVGDSVIILSGTDANKALTITTVAATFVECTDTGLTIESGVHIQIGRGGARLRMFLVDGEAAVNNHYGLRLELTSTATTLLGLPPGAEIRSRPTSTKAIATSILTPLFTATPVTTESLDVTAETIEKAAFLIYTEELVGDTSSPSANTLSITYGGSAAVVGSVLLLRSGPDAGTYWVVTAVGSGSLTASGTSTPTPTADVSYVVGYGNLEEKERVSILSGLNLGNYEIQGVRTGGLIVDVFPSIPSTFDANGPLKLDAVVEARSITVSSIDKTTASRVKVAGPAALELFGFDSIEGTGTTRFFKLPEVVTGLGVGDFLDFYETTYTLADEQHRIVNIEGDILELESSIDSLVSWAFQGPPPFAALRSLSMGAYATLRVGLLAWTNSRSSTFWNNLQRAMNPLLFDTNPSAVEQGTARNLVLSLYKLLSRDGAVAAGTDPEMTLEAALDAYTAPNIPTIDALLRTLQEKGLDRAVDLLTRCRVKEVFDSSIEDLSFSGRLQTALRDVARLDLPIRRDDRAAAFQSPQTYADENGVDYEYEPDTTPTTLVDPPPTKKP